jgi:SAM-dependent methyltransferase
MSLEQELEAYAHDAEKRQAEWFRYYSEKRLPHQYMQVDLLRGLGVKTVLEIGPYLGFVSVLLANAGFAVTGLDSGPALSGIEAIGHIRSDLMAAPIETLSGYDAILCCEMLEHFEWAEVDSLLRRLWEAQPKYLVISVPYMGFQIDWRLYWNAVSLRQYFSLKKFARWKAFKKDPVPWGHKWEAGYRGHGLRALEAKLAQNGWQIARRAFTSPCRSVFYLLQREAPGAAFHPSAATAATLPETRGSP